MNSKNEMIKKNLCGNGLELHYSKKVLTKHAEFEMAN